MAVRDPRPWAHLAVALLLAGGLAGAQEAPAPPLAPAVDGDRLDRLTRAAELRLRDFGRSTLLGLDRAERLRLAAARAAARTLEGEGVGPGTSDAELLERLWSDAAWTVEAEYVLDGAERVAFAERGHRRVAACERSASRAAAALLARRAQLPAVSRDRLVPRAVRPPAAAATEDSATRYRRIEAVVASDLSKLGSLGAAQRRRLLLSADGIGAGAAAGALVEADLEVFVAIAGLRGGLAERDRGLLFDCGRRAILVAAAEPEREVDPLDDPILTKALATIAGRNVAAEIARERTERETELRASRIEWLIAELDRLLWFSEVQAGALRLVLDDASELADLDPRAPLPAVIAGLSRGSQRSLEALLEREQLAATDLFGGRRGAKP